MNHLLAAVDLGSNSFRLSIGRVVQQDGIAHIYAVDRLKESVQLAAGLDANDMLDDASMQRALTVLKRYGERLKGFDPEHVRAVATSTFRVAKNVDVLLPLAEEALGFPIEIIAGQEEARLIFTGVANELPPSQNRRLVIDIGGGSTEFIIGRGFEPLQLSSLLMGCVSYTQRFFADGKITADRMDRAILAARREIETISKRFRKLGWLEAYGSSGTAKALYAILTDSKLSSEGITVEGLEKLRRKLVLDGEVKSDELPGLKPSRSDVLAGGLAIMLAAFHELKIKRMGSGEGALRMGVLYDLLGRESNHDKRDETSRQFMRRYHVDTNQALRVKQAALKLFEPLDIESDEKEVLQKMLGWAAELHEIGFSITSDHYHRHSAYILQHADMPGFSNDEQAILSWLALGHLGKLAKIKGTKLSKAWWAALMCLRLSVLLMRGRKNMPKLPLQLDWNNNQMTVIVDKKWLQDHALTAYSLENEIAEWGRAGFNVTVAPR